MQVGEIRLLSTSGPSRAARTEADPPEQKESVDLSGQKPEPKFGSWTRPPGPASDRIQKALADRGDIRDLVQSLRDDSIYGPAARLALEASAGVESAFGRDSLLRAAMIDPRMETPAELRNLSKYLLSSYCGGAGSVVFGRLAQVPEWSEAARFTIDLAEKSGAARLTVYQTALEHLEARTPEEKLAIGKAALAHLQKYDKSDQGLEGQASLGRALMPLLGPGQGPELALRMADSTYYHTDQARIFAALLEDPRVAELDDLTALAGRCLHWNGDGPPARVLIEEVGKRPGGERGSEFALLLYDSCKYDSTRVALGQALLAQPRVHTPRQLVDLVRRTMELADSHPGPGMVHDPARMGQAALHLLLGQPATSHAAQQGLKQLEGVTSPQERKKIIQATLVVASVGPEHAKFVEGLTARLSSAGCDRLFELLPSLPSPGRSAQFRQALFEGLPGELGSDRSFLAGELARERLPFLGDSIDALSQPGRVGLWSFAAEQPTPEDPALYLRQLRPQLGARSDQTVIGRKVLELEPPRLESKMLGHLLAVASPEQQADWLDLALAWPDSHESGEVRAASFARALVDSQRDSDRKLGAAMAEALAEQIPRLGPLDPGLPLAQMVSRFETAAQEIDELRRIAEQKSVNAGLRDDPVGLDLPGVRVRKRTHRPEG